MGRRGERVREPRQQSTIPTTCRQCYSDCPILVRTVDGVATRIEINSEIEGYRGTCGKGAAALMMLYDPYRLNVPLKRTNPHKGIGVDPKWKRITWDEAFQEIVERFQRIQKDDPRKLFGIWTTTMGRYMTFGCLPFFRAFGTRNTWTGGGGVHCGNGTHFIAGMLHGSWSIIPDFDLCNYVIAFGGSKGTAAGHGGQYTVKKAADARARGAKIVAVDPMCHFSGGKAKEWIPIRPGTDGALALAMANLILNELGIWDAEYLKYKTNAPYLIKGDGRYLRDKKTDKPLVWDATEKRAKTFDDPSVRDFALEGEYSVDGISCEPAFQLLKNHLRKYTCEIASKITTVPEETIRRIAREFSQAACVGSTIMIDGKRLPYRPCSAIYFKGIQGHKASTNHCASVSLLNHILGAADVPGGTLGFNPAAYGYPETGRPSYWPFPNEDGFLRAGIWHGVVGHMPYPVPRPRLPITNILANDLFPVATTSSIIAASDGEAFFQKAGLPYRPEAALCFGCNVIMNTGNPQLTAETFRKIPFMVYYGLFLNETAEFADIVLPDTCYLETLDVSPCALPITNQPAGMTSWNWHVQQPVVPPQFERRPLVEFLIELAERLDILDKLNEAYNFRFNISGSHKLARGKKYTWEEICDRVLRSHFGEEHDLAWFKRNGYISWPKKVEEAYWRWFADVRVPIYYEFMKNLGEETEKLSESIGIHLDWRHYTPLPEYFPCVSHEEADPTYDLYAFNYRDILHTGSTTPENPFIDEVSQMNPYTYNIVINADTAKKKGLKDGDYVAIGSPKGRMVKGHIRLMKGIHPECIAIAGTFGRWAKGEPIARGKGVCFDTLLEIDFDHMDPVSLSQDTCVKVKVHKVGEERKNEMGHGH